MSVLNSTENYKEEDHDTQFGLPIIILQDFILVTIFLISVVGNFLVCITAWKQKIIRKTTWSYIFSLAFYDVGATMLSIPILIYTIYDASILHNDKVCQLSGFCLVFFFLASVMTLAVISIHKCLCVQYPLYWKASDNSISSIWLIWLIAFAIAIAPIIGWSKYQHVADGRQCLPRIENTKADFLYILILLLLGFATPLVTMIFCYSIVYFETKKHIERMKQHTLNRSVIRDIEILTTVIIIVFTFLCCWCPFAVCLGIMLAKGSTPVILLHVALFCGYAQSAINPVIYALRHEMFREAFKSVICCRNYVQHDIKDSSASILNSRPSIIDIEAEKFVYYQNVIKNTTDMEYKDHEVIFNHKPDFYDNINYES